MSAVTLTVKVNKDQLTTLQNDIKILDGKNIKLSVKIDGLSQIDAETRKGLNALARLETAKAKTARANADLAKSENAVKVAQEKTEQSMARMRSEQEKTERAALNYANQINKQSAETETFGKVAEQSADKAGKFGDAIEQIGAKLGRWALRELNQSMREALDTMKAVDDELVVVGKVSNATDEQLRSLEERAYKTGTAYGVGAQKHLNSVAEFTRGGYREQAADLAELAVKTQLVGDVTAETANQFLLSVDKAYQYEGSIQKLSAVLDGANEIDNKYATSIQKIAEGMGIIAPLAAQAHVGIDELAAGIGTITAVTQRSGTEASRAYRALILNIIGDTKTEIDEGVTWTTGEIAGLRDVIKKYASDAYEAAQASGEVINPMKAIAGLAQSMKDGVLSEAKLMEMVSDIGGKLRSSQLLALIQNWEMYESMVADFGDAFGSADKEVENALNSWTAKTNQLKNTWAEFVHHIIETDAIKDSLDALRGVISGLDNGFGHFIVTVTGLFTVLSVAEKILKTGFLPSVQTLKTVLARYTTEAGVAAGATAAFKAALTGFVVAAVIAAIYGVVKAIDKAVVTTKEAIDAAKQAREEYENFIGSGSEYDSLVSKITDLDDQYIELFRSIGNCTDEQQKLLDQAGGFNSLIDQTHDLTEAEKKRLIVLQQLAAAKEEAAKAALQTAYDKFADEPIKVRQAAVDFYGDTFTYDAYADAATAAQYLYEEYSDAIRQRFLNGSNNLSNIAYASLVHDIMLYYEDAYTQLKDFQEKGQELTPDHQRFVNVYEEMAASIDHFANMTGDAADATQDIAEAQKTAAQTADALKKRMEAVSKAQKDYQQYGNLTEKTLEDLEAAIPGVTANLYDQDGALTDVAKSALSAESGMYELRAAEIIFNNTSMDVSQKIAALQLLATQAGIASAALVNAAQASALQGEIDNLTYYGGMSLSDAQSYVLSKYAKNLFGANENKDPKQTGGGGGGSKKDPALEALESEIALLQSELTLLEKQNAAVGKRITKMREIQDALHRQAEYLRAHGGSQTEINKLSAQWLDIQEDIAALQKEQLENAKELIKSYVDGQNKALDEQKKALQDARDIEKDRLDIAERELAVREALEKLQNAQNERTVRQYNAATGQWEWVANAKNVKNAQEEYEKALADLKKLRDDQEYQAKLDAIEKEKELNNSLWDGLEKAIDTFIDALSHGAAGTDDAFSGLLDILTNANIKSSELYEQIIIALMKANSQAWLTASDEMRNKLHGYNQQLGQLIGAKYQEYTEEGRTKGAWYKDGMLLYSLDPNAGTYETVLGGSGGSGTGGGSTSSGGSKKEYSSAGYEITGYYTMETGKNAPAGLSTGTVITTKDEKHAYQIVEAGTPGATQNPENGYWRIQLYDSGGVLHGLGGIKATASDEMVLPPDITRAMLHPALDMTTRERFDELRWLYGVDRNRPSQSAGGTTYNGAVTHGNVYTINGVRLSEDAAKRMTVYDLVRQSGALGIYGGRM